MITMNRIIHNTIKVAKKAKIDVDKTWGQIAAEAQCSESYLWKILHDQEPGDDKKPAIAKALGVSIETLWPPESDHISRV